MFYYNDKGPTIMLLFGVYYLELGRQNSSAKLEQNKRRNNELPLSNDTRNIFFFKTMVNDIVLYLYFLMSQSSIIISMKYSGI